MKTAMITGIDGQTASYLAEFLLDRGDYRVIGISRRSTRVNDNLTACLDNVNFSIETMDITDASGMRNIISEHKPDEFYNLAAQSHVGQSFKEPLTTLMIDGYAVAGILEGIRHESPNTRFYQASTSEMFGTNGKKVHANGVEGLVQDETTPLSARSPYAAAKIYAYNMTKLYREAYDLYACSGILFNHECLFYNTPVIIKKDNLIDIVYIGSLVANRKNFKNDSKFLTKDYTSDNIEIWDGNNWVDLKAVSRKKLSLLDKKNQKKLVSNTRRGTVNTTPNHNLIINGMKVSARETLDKELDHGKMPENFQNIVSLNEDFAYFLGLLCGDGYISTKIRLTNNDNNIRMSFGDMAIKLGIAKTYYMSKEYKSGFEGKTNYVELRGVDSNFVLYLRDLLYDKRTKHKKIPNIILNADRKLKLAFLKGYNFADGLKKDKTKYQFKSFKTNSELLGQGLLYLIHCTTQQSYNINAFNQNGKIYYQINLHSDDQNLKGNHLTLNPFINKKNIYQDVDNQHVFDIETGSGVFMGGIGVMIVGNSPRRPAQFVTRKITDGVARVKKGLQDHVCLGNLEAYRDWGHAKDYVQAMWLMLQQSNPDDFVIGTGKAASVQMALEYVCDLAGLDFSSVYKIDEKYMRPAEVPYLRADPSRAHKQLGWRPIYDWKMLLREMYENDIKSLS